MADTTEAGDELLTTAFSLYSNPGAYALLLGAGVSASSGIPTAWNLLLDLVKQVATLEDEAPEDPAAWYVERFSADPTYEAVLEKLGPTQIERQRLLRGYFQRSEKDVEAGAKLPTAAHKAIARLVRAGAVRVIVTLNFDHLIEQAIRDEGIEPTIVASSSDIKGMAPLHMLDCCVVHLHGDYLNPTSMRNTVAELEGYDLDTEQLLERILQDYGLIVAGWSARYDPALRDAIAAHYSTRLTMTWIERSSSSEDAAQLRTLKRGALVTTEADAAFGRLADGVTALATRGSRHPLTIPVAVETAKRELAGRPVAIGLHDTLRRELDQLHDRPEFHVFNQRDADPYEDLLGRVEEATLLPSALLATLGYWGDDETDRWWIPEIPRFATGVAGSGSVKLLNLRIVSGSMLFYAAGVSAVAAQRYHLLHQLFAARRPNRQTGNYETLAVSLDASASYEGIPNRDTRLLSNLAPVLGESLQVGSAPLDDAWQMFEVLRAAWAVSRHPRFEELRTEYGPADLKLRTAEEAYEKALQQTGTSDQTLQTARHTAWQSHDRILGSLGRLANIGRPHVLTDQINWSDGRNSSIVARKLIDDLTFEGEIHPIVSSGLFKSHEDAVIATQAVDTNFGAIGYHLKFENMPVATGFIPTEIWLDGSTSRQNDE